MAARRTESLPLATRPSIDFKNALRRKMNARAIGVETRFRAFARA
jgi:hypothetical protein